ncbi:MAG: hypothetical protein HBSAPP03_16470 [Phycisphaerae bacterium]|nr:MAG: hypothetical protein HBSAPP03_16470 [Phycisphaerae bacterium]
MWAFLAMLALASGASAQAVPPTSAAGFSVGEVSITADRFGVGDISRRGDWVGVRLVLKDNTSRQRSVLIRVASLDPDGDQPTYELERTLNPGVEQKEWVYVRLPFRFTSEDALVVSIYEAVVDDATRRLVAGRLLARRAVTPNKGSLRVESEGLIGVVGSRALGLLKYQHEATDAEQSNTDTWHPLGHERSRIVTGITALDLPDRWMGLASLDALVWAVEDSGQWNPTQLTGERARAVREWVERGGHFIIILPRVGQTWSDPTSNELHDLMPVVAVQRNENVDLGPYRPLINARERRTGAAWPRSGVVHTFRRIPEAGAADAMEILNGPDGRCVVVRRLVGAGAVTLVGLDLNQTALSQGDLIDAEVFWHRVLGRRGRLTEVLRDGPGRRLGVSRTPWPYDDDIGGQIVQGGRAAVGVLAGFVMFVAYWLVAGPLGFMVLRSRGQHKHAWVGFVGVTLVFTGLAWGGASLLRPGKVEGRHLTILDHVYGQPTQRARTWASILIPWYGTAQIEVGERNAERSLNAIVAWDSPKDDSSWSGFPDSRGYVIDTRKPDAIEVPTRSTSKVIQADWAGGPRWKMPIPTAADGAGSGVLTVNQDWTRGSNTPLVTGMLVHDLPGTLRDVTLIVVRRQTPLRDVRADLAALETAPLVVANAFSLASWEPKVPLDLGAKTTVPAGQTGDGAALVQWLNSLKPSFSGTMYPGMVPEVTADTARLTDRLTALAVFPYLPPPDLEGGTTNEYAAQRKSTHGWDLGRWFTQPCVIIIGHLGGARSDSVECPVPIRVDGEEFPLTGRTVVRWVYPLPTNPPAFPMPDGADPTLPEPTPSASNGGEG